ncbi:hypothetical protein B0T18DRAFT_48260 [Schizothecium vesticola]|uniref:Uncharacterized protein n=1 Tax=Schizothecium vesticola TaxID=314040 RepID=A0AA40FBT8_9PEZI|nr:hypothetical protein B0T18DRAFT_48260 [Schizothecium vesticola]
MQRIGIPRRQTPIGGDARRTFVMRGPNRGSRSRIWTVATAGFQLAGSSKAFCPSTAFSRPLGRRLAASAADETGEDSESPTGDVRREERGGSVGFPDSDLPPSSRIPVVLCAARLDSLSHRRQHCIYAPPFQVIEARQQGNQGALFLCRMKSGMKPRWPTCKDNGFFECS